MSDGNSRWTPAAPLVDLRIPIGLVAEIARVAESPFRQLAVVSPCGGGSPAGNGFSSVAYWVSVEILREVNGRGLVEGRPGVLKIGRDVGAIINAGTRRITVFESQL